MGQVLTYNMKDLQVRTWDPAEAIRIGSYCSIADRVIVCAGGRHHSDFASTFPFDRLLLQRPQDRVYQTTRDTTIGNDVWIGTGAMIFGGVHVGDGAVISGGSVVSSDIPPYAVAAGNPAGVVRYRFSKTSIARLLQIGWWNWPDEKVRDNIDWFYRPIQEFLDHFDPPHDHPA